MTGTGLFSHHAYHLTLTARHSAFNAQCSTFNALRRNVQRNAFTASAVTSAGWPPYVARR
jgi:hypothetical protein